MTKTEAMRITRQQSVLMHLGFTLHEADALILYTDGVSEAFNPQDECYGDDRLLAAAAGLSGQPAPAITLAEISARIPAESPVARFFHEADLSAYGGHAGGDILPQWRELLTEAIASLTPTAR